MTTTQPVLDTDRSDLLSTLEKHRGFLRQTLDGLTEEQIRLRPTASALCLGGLVKHVTRCESRWVDFILDGPGSIGEMDEAAYAAHADSFEVGDATRESLLEDYARVAARTAEVVAGLSSLDASQPLPEAPWFEPGAAWTARRALMHTLAETAQHAGHADIIRESIDGAKTMG